MAPLQEELAQWQPRLWGYTEEAIRATSRCALRGCA